MKIANKRGKPSKTINCIRYVLYTGNPLIYLYGTTSHWIEHTQKYYSIWNSFIVLNCCRQHCAFVVDVVVVDANDDIVIVYSFHTWFVYPFHLFLSPWALSSSLWPPGLPFSWSFFYSFATFTSHHLTSGYFANLELLFFNEHSSNFLSCFVWLSLTFVAFVAHHHHHSDVQTLTIHSNV